MVYDTTTVPNTYHSSRVLSPVDLSRWINLIRDVLPARNGDLYLHFFPEAMNLSNEMLWTRSDLIEVFIENGFSILSHGTVDQEASPDFEVYFQKIMNRAYSDLALISDEAFKNGLSRMSEQRASLQGCPVREGVYYFVFQRRS